MIFNKLFGKYKFVTMSVILAFLTVCLIALIIFLFGNEDGSLPEADSTVTEPTEYIHEDSGESLSGDSCILLLCSDTGSDDIIFMLLADFKIYSSSIVLTPLFPETKALNGKTLSENYSYGGINQLRDSIEQIRSIHIDRYAVLTRSGVTNLTELMGEITLDVKESFSYQSSDKTYEVEKGETQLGSDMLFTYFGVYAERYGDVKTAELICNMANTYIASLKDTEIDHKNLFSKLTNCFSTDLTISDYYSALSDIEYLSKHDLKCTVADDMES